MSAPDEVPQGVPSEEELRAAYEAELARITATDMIAQAAVSLLNIGARRMGPPPAPAGAEQPPGAGADRDLEQTRDAIDASMALLEILARRLPAEQLAPLRDALSRLQMAYASELGAQSSGAGVPRGEPGPGAGAGEGGGGVAPDGDDGEDEDGGGGSSGGGPSGGGAPGGPQPSPGAGEGDPAHPQRPGPAESSGRLWVPGR